MTADGEPPGDRCRRRLLGRDRNDVMSGLGGNDRLYGGTGDDVMYGGAGDDWIEGASSISTHDLIL